VPVPRDPYAKVLDWCNRIRSHLGAPEVPSLRKGQCQDSGRCALTNTINYRLGARKRVQVDESEVYRGDDAFEPDEVVAKTPRYVESFIRDFDRGKHPDLIGTGWVADRQ
jgi:hypothetical protein